jgi:hypothetical protein
MATLKDCIRQVKAELTKAAKQSPDDASMHDIQRLLELSENGQIGDTDLLAALSEVKMKVETLAKVKKRNAMLNKIRTREIDRFVMEHYPNDPIRGLEAMITGIQSVKKGARDSVERRMDELERRYLGAFTEELERKPELMGLMRDKNPEVDREIARALEIVEDGADASEVNPMILELAKIMHKYQEVARNEANEAGAWIGKMKGYVVRQSHDPAVMIRGRKGSGLTDADAIKQDWIDRILPRLDQERTFGIEDPRAFLSGVYDNLVTGIHQTSSMKDGPQIALTGFKNVGRSMSRERVLHFKSADDWYSYNQEFGSKTLRQAYVAGLLKSANDTAMMQMFGPNARGNLEAVTRKHAERLKNEGGNIEQARKLNAAWGDNGRFTKMMNIVDGTANSIHPTRAGVIAANAGAMYRASVVMAKLGSMVLSMVSDTALFASVARHRTDRGWFAGMGRSVGGLLESLGGTREEKRRAAQRLGVFHDAMIQSVGARFGMDRDLSAGVQSAMNGFMKMNLAAWWTDAMRMGAVTMFGTDVGRAVGQKFDDLGNLGRALKSAGIDEAEWDAIRKATTEEFNGNAILYPESIADLSDDVITGYVEKTGLKATPRAISEARNRLQAKLRGFYVDSAESAVLNPDAKTNFYLQKHNPRGTFEGELARHVAILKSFGFAVVEKALGAEVFGRGYEYNPNISMMRNAGRALRENAHGELTGVMALLGGMSAMGYATIILKDYVKGKDPILPGDDNFDEKILLRSVVQGGGLGILGDFLINETMNDRYGHNPIVTVAGPMAGTVDDVRKVLQATMFGEEGDLPDALQKAIIHHTPYQNHFALRPVLDYAILHSLSEAINPGYLERSERRHTRETGQTYWAPPSQGGPVAELLGD